MTAALGPRRPLFVAERMRYHATPKPYPCSRSRQETRRDAMNAEKNARLHVLQLVIIQ
jgi:hypothetical protein